MQDNEQLAFAFKLIIIGSKLQGLVPCGLKGK